MIQATRGFIVVPVFVASLAGCSHTERLPKGHESSSVTSPDGLSRAFVWMPETSGFLGATVSTPYQVWIKYLEGDHPPALLLKAYHTDGVRVTWTSATELAICYEEPTHIYDFRNYFEYAEQHWNHLYKVEILLKRVQKLGEC